MGLLAPELASFFLAVCTSPCLLYLTYRLSIADMANAVKRAFRLVCGSYFCAACLLEHAMRNGLPPPAILRLGAPSLLACRLRCRRNGMGRWLRLLAFGLLFTKTLLLTGLTREVA